MSTQAPVKSAVQGATSGCTGKSAGGSVEPTAPTLLYDRNTEEYAGLYLGDASGNEGDSIRFDGHSYRAAGHASGHPTLLTVQLASATSRIRTIPSQISALTGIAVTIAAKNAATLGDSSYYFPFFERSIALRMENKRADACAYVGGSKTTFANAWPADITDWHVMTYEVKAGKITARIDGEAIEGTTTTVAVPTARTYMFGGGSNINHAPFMKFGEMRIFDMAAEDYSTAGLIANEAALIAKWL